MLKDEIKLIEDIFNTDFKPCNRITNRKYWDSVNPQLKISLLEKANSFQNADFNLLTASLYMDYFKTGNRKNFEDQYFLRREALHCLVIAECIMNRREYLTTIIDLIWMILEETTWVIPAHNVSFGYKTKDINHPLYFRDIDMLDLFSCETGATISIACHILKDKLDEVSPFIYERAQSEVEKRLLIPYMNRTDFSFMGFVQGPYSKVNNWNPWINSNCLYCLVLSSMNKQKKVYILKKILSSIDIYLDNYNNDGGCDEGPAYYSHSVGSLLVLLELVYEITDGRFNIINNTKVRNMVEYIVKAHIDKNMFVNYADSRPKILVPPALLFRYGKQTDNINLMSFGAYLFKVNKDNRNYRVGFGKILRFISSYDEMKNYSNEYVKINKTFFEDLQVFNIRNGSTFLSVKGGHNNESHNHNDVGNFILYYKNIPLIIDIGNQTYCSKTFSDERYSIWTNKSDYHNLPIINGSIQSNGEKYKARNVVQRDNKIFMDLTMAYDEKANLESYTREVDYNVTKGEIILSESILPKDRINTYSLVLMSKFLPEITDNSISISFKDHVLVIYYDENIFDCNYETIKITDSILKENFNDKLYRIQFAVKVPTSELNYKLIFKIEKSTIN